MTTQEEHLARSSDHVMFMRYLFATLCLAAIIIFNDYRTETVIREALDTLTNEVRSLDMQWCEAINRMHEVRGYKVMDCDTGRVLLVPSELTNDGS